MKKLNKKVLNVMATSALVASVVAPFGASAATTNRVSTTPTLEQDQEGVVTLGVINLREDKEFMEDMVSGSTFTITLPDGVEVDAGTVISYKEYSAATGAVVGTTPLAAANVEYVGDQTINVTLPAAVSDATVDGIEIALKATLDNPENGPVVVTIDDLDSGITGGKFTVAQIGDGDTTTTVLDTKTVGEGKAAAGVIRITENSVNAIGEGQQTLTLRLPKDIDWVTDEDTNNEANEVNVDFVGGLSGTALDSVDLNDAGDVLTIKFTPNAGRTQKGIIQVKTNIDVSSKADIGDIEVNVDGSEISEADVKIGTYADYGITAKADGEVKTVIAGRNGTDDKDDTVAQKIQIKENVADSITANRKTKIVFPAWVKIQDVKVEAKNMTGTEAALKAAILAGRDDNETEFTMPAGNGGKLDLKLEFQLSVEAGKEGDIEAEISGRSGVEGKVLVAKAVSPVSASVEAKDVKVGIKGQEVGDIIITENVKGAFFDGKTVRVELPDNVEFTSKPKVEVIEGNLDINESSVTKNDNVVTFKVDSESSKPSKIKISGVKLDLDRTIPEGAIEVKLKGDSIIENNNATPDDDDFDNNTFAKAVLANVVTPAPGEVSNVVKFVIDNDKYTVNGVEKTADVAPYIQDGRTMLPVRFVAEAVGVTDANIIWNANTKTVTLIKGDRIAQIQLGSKNLIVNGVTVAMDTVATVKNGRTVLPLSFVAQALGAKVSWDDATRTVTIN